jgi:hypothetical protein
MDRTNIKCYYNGTLIFNIEQNAFSKGTFGIYGANGTVCNAFKVESAAILGWERSWKTDQTGCVTTVASNGLQVIQMQKGTDSDLAGVHTYINTEAGEDYTLSVNYTGSIAMNVVEGETTLAEATGYSESGDTVSLLFTPTGTSVDVNINANGESLTIKEPQIEQRTFATSFTADTRESSLFSFPASKIDRYHGAISMWVSPIHDYSDGILPIFYYNNSFKAVYSNGGFSFTYGDSVLTVPYTLTAKGKYHIICRWLNGSDIAVNIYDEMTDTLDELSITEKTIDISGVIYFGCTPTICGNLTMDTLIGYSGNMTVDQMKSFRSESSTNDNRIVINSNFTNNTLMYTNNKIIIPKSKPLTPIIVEDEGGNTYERVYFVNNGEYTIYDKKTFTYTGTNTFTVDYDDILSARAYTDTTVYNDLSIDGALITVNDLPLNSTTITEVTIEYTPRNVFSIVYDKASDEHLVQLCNTNGSSIVITYENDFGAETKLVDTVEANPFKSANNNGFVYVTQKPIPVTTLDAMATPDALLADGHQVSTIIIDCIGQGGVPTSNASLAVSLANGNKYGRIEKYISDEEQQWINLFEAEKALNGEEAATEKYGNLITDEHMSGDLSTSFM